MIRSKYRELDLHRELVIRLRHRVFDDRDSGQDNDIIKIKELSNSIADLQRQIADLQM
jgi:hypothetical protein